MKQILAAAAMALVVCAAQAQTYHDSGGTIVPGVVPIQPGVGPLFTPSNPGNVAGTFSASLGGFMPTPSYQSLSASDVLSHRVPVPTGTVDVVYNTSSSIAYCTFGNSSVAATASNDVIQANSWVAFTVPTVSGGAYIACISPSGNLAINVSGGAGLPTGSGGGGGGGSGGGGVVTQSTATNLNATVVGTGGAALATSADQPALNGDGGALAHVTNFPTTQAVSGSVTVNQGGSNWSQNLSQINGSAVTTGPGASASTNAQRVATSTDSPGGAQVNPAFNNVMMNVTGTQTLVPGTAHGLSIDTSSSSNLAALLQGGTGTFGLAYPTAGIATGTKGSGYLNPLVQADHSAPIRRAVGSHRRRAPRGRQHAPTAGPSGRAFFEISINKYCPYFSSVVSGTQRGYDPRSRRPRAAAALSEPQRRSRSARTVRAINFHTEALPNELRSGEGCRSVACSPEASSPCRWRADQAHRRHSAPQSRGARA
jgi:hypothetical protein